MKRKLIMAISILAGAATMLTAVFVLESIAVRVESIQTAWLRGVCVVVTLGLGVLLLVGATYFSTHLVVRLFRREAEPPGQ